MEAKNYAAVIIPSSDPHQSEYVADHWQTREWISGFSGSAGVAFVTLNHAGVSTDSRYFLQAEQELAESDFELHKQVIPHQPQIITWLINNLSEGDQVIIDPTLFTIRQCKKYEATLSKHGINLKFDTNMMNIVWENRPALPTDPIFELKEDQSGASRLSKIEAVREQMRSAHVDYHLLTTLDDIAWLFNIRGKDVVCNPVAIAYAVLSHEATYLFINESKIPDTLSMKFKSENIRVLPYDQIFDFLSKIEDGTFMLLDPSRVNAHLSEAMEHLEIHSSDNPSTLLKSLKNNIEITHIKQAMLKDGVALTALYMWLENTLKERPVKETEVASKLDELRKAQGGYHGESFSAIVGYNGNGAIVHYRAKEEDCAEIKANGILLLDSGGQYETGTTDITRTIALSIPTEQQKRNYTLVLKGHIALAKLRFPSGTTGAHMDILARQSLWAHGLNYGHGTGHGVGFFLNVHEGPQGIGSGLTGKATIPFEAGMLTSNEPGFYQTGEYGIRIENLVLCVEDQETPFGQFLKFETLTLFPIDTQLIDFTLLTKNEVAWLNDYHALVLEKLSPLLSEEASLWMREKCKAV